MKSDLAMQASPTDVFGGVWISTKLEIVRWDRSKRNLGEETRIELPFFPVTLPGDSCCLCFGRFRLGGPAARWH